MRDLYNSIDPVVLIGAATLAADNTPAALDLGRAQSATILISVGVGGITFDATNKVEFKLTHSDDDSTYTAVADADMLGGLSVGSGGIILSLVAAHAAAALYKRGYRGNKRYLKLLADFSGTHGTGTPIGANVIKGHLPDNPPIA